MAVAWKIFNKIPATGTCFWRLIVHILANKLLATQSHQPKYWQSAFT
ncbi:MAG: hypothetical protein KME40_30450 [Komarekiella atlantica HA4396-MV6]|nr:hypothetical protein [Komarekiella atlantica HA4396-MV6]